MDDPKPFYVFLIIILIFIFLWFFIGGKESEFVGLKPLDPDHIMTYADSYYTPTRKRKSEIKPQVSYKNTSITSNNTSNTSNTSKNDTSDTNDTVEENINDKNDDNICVNLTPQLPDEFVRQTCVPDNDKYVSKGEKICRDTMEKIYGVPFKNTRPYWLKNDTTGRCLELDCYNEKLKLAVEMNGCQHYKYPNIFHKTHHEFKEQVRRDKLKIELCKEHGVHLIVVPYNVPYDLIPTYIMYHLPEIVKKRLHNENIIK